jgi:16S rRNA (uracil1498-N3)-methyltransferase
MPKHFFAPADKNGDTIRISGDAAHHLIHVLRLRIGDSTTLCDGANTDYSARLLSHTRNDATFAIESAHACTTEPRIKIHLFAALLKGERMAWLVQKCVELGVTEITPTITAHTIAREKSAARLAKIAEAAASQSMRGIIPPLHPPLCLHEATATLRPGSTTLVAHEKENTRTIAHIPPATEANIFIGPEGGFTTAEVDSLRSIGAHSISLGATILRAETAAITATAQILCLWGSK